MNLADASVRHRILTSGPLGAWRTVPGTHGALYCESIQFDADGTGRMQSVSSLGGTTTQPFRWRSAGHAVVECQPIYDMPEIGEAGAPEASDWLRITFVIEQRATDVGEFWVLREADADGFWDLMTPLVPET
jgi:hypothetical protein